MLACRRAMICAWCQTQPCPVGGKIILMIGAMLCCGHHATAQERVVGGKYRADLQKLCPDIPPGNNNLQTYMREHIRDVSLPCLVTLAKFAEVRRSLVQRPPSATVCECQT